MPDDPLSHVRIDIFDEPQAVGQLVAASLRAGVAAVSANRVPDGVSGPQPRWSLQTPLKHAELVRMLLAQQRPLPPALPPDAYHIAINALDLDGVAGVLWHGYRAVLSIHPPPAQYGATERPQYMAEVTRAFWHSDDGNNQTESSDGFFPSLLEAARSAANAFISRFGPPDLTCEEQSGEPHHQ